MPNFDSMKDPVTLGTALSGGTMLVLAIWKSRALRWFAICAAIVALVWAIRADPASVPDDLDATPTDRVAPSS